MALREIAADFQVNVEGAEKITKLEHQVDEAKKSLHEFGISLKNFAIEAGEIFAFEELREFVHGQVELGEAIERTAAETGLSTNELQKWQYVAEQSALATDTVANAIGRLQANLGGGAKGKHGMAGASLELQKLGIKLKDVHDKTRPVGDIFLEVADKVAKTEDPTKRAGIAVQVFGKQGREILPVLMKGKKGIKEMTEEAEKMGFILGEDFLGATKKAAEEQTKLNWSMRALKATVAMELFPAFTKITDKVMQGVKWFGELSKQTTFVKTALAALGFAAGVRLLGPLKELLGISKGKGLIENIFGMGKLAATLVGLAMLYLAWDEIFGLFTGKRTWIGDMIDKIFGKGVSDQGVRDIKQAWKDIIEAITGAHVEGDALETWWGAFASTVVTGAIVIGRTIGRAFGSLAAEIGQLVSGAKLLLAMATGNDAEKKAAQYNYDIAKTATDKMHASVFDYSDVKWGQPTGYAGNIEASKKGLSEENTPAARARAQRSGRNSGVVVHQNITVHGGDPKKVEHAVHQGTSQALAQNDLRHTYQAVRSTSPAQTSNYKPMGDPWVP